jgi:cell division protein FtsI/penicillin-binding protein 2
VIGDLKGVTITMAIVVVMLIATLPRVIQLKLDPDPRINQMSGAVTTTTSQIARRGDLLDRAGRVLATSTVGHRLFLDPSLLENPDTIAIDLHHLAGVDPAQIQQRLQDATSTKYVAVIDLLTDEQTEALQSGAISGVGVEPRLVRHYPGEGTAEAFIGVVGFEHTGLGGAEFMHDKRLTGRDGALTWLRDVHRRPLWIDPGGFDPVGHGEDLRLSIDLEIQRIAESHLRTAVETYHAAGGRVIVLDTRSGELLAITDSLRSRPGWDEHVVDPIRETMPRLARNRCVTDPYEPGSTFKPFIWAAATEFGVVTEEEVLPTPSHTGHRTRSGRLIRDAHYYGPASWRKVLIKSMNSGMAIVAERMTPREMQHAVTTFGFGSPTRVGLPGETSGILTSPKKWTTYTQTSVAMGHEIAVTPLQMVRAFSAFCRDGTMPTLKNVADDLGTPTDPAQESATDIVQRAISSSTAQQTRLIMRDVMTQGTGRRAQSTIYQLFGKSGTAQLPIKGGGGYHEDRYVSSFIAGAPLNEPRLAVLCIIDDPDRSKAHYGGIVAGPVVRNIIDETLAYLQIPPDIPQDDLLDAARQSLSDH